MANGITSSAVAPCQPSPNRSATAALWLMKSGYMSRSMVCMAFSPVMLTIQRQQATILFDGYIKKPPDA